MPEIPEEWNPTPDECDAIIKKVEGLPPSNDLLSRMQATKADRASRPYPAVSEATWAIFNPPKLQFL